MLDKDGNLIDPSINKQPDNKGDPENKGEPMIPKSRLDQVSSQLRAEREERAKLEARVNELSLKKPTEDDLDLERAAESLMPILEKRGFLTKQEKEQEDSARRYSEDLDRLSKKYNGEDGKPKFDPYEIGEYAKKTKIFDLEAAYENKYKKELFDYELRQLNGGDVDTEGASRPVLNDGTNHDVLTRDYIAKKLASPGGSEWYEKNREALLKAMEKGQIR